MGVTRSKLHSCVYGHGHIMNWPQLSMGMARRELPAWGVARTDFTALIRGCPVGGARAAALASGIWGSLWNLPLPSIDMVRNEVP